MNGVKRRQGVRGRMSGANEDLFRGCATSGTAGPHLVSSSRFGGESLVRTVKRAERQRLLLGRLPTFHLGPF